MKIVEKVLIDNRVTYLVIYRGRFRFRKRRRIRKTESLIRIELCKLQNEKIRRQDVELSTELKVG